jgi:hypothetical protein
MDHRVGRRASGDEPTVTFYVGSLSAPASLSVPGGIVFPPLVTPIKFALEDASFWIGANPSNRDPFHGYLDDIRLYDSALSLEEVEAVRLSGSRGSDAQILVVLPSAAGLEFSFAVVGRVNEPFTIEATTGVSSPWSWTPLLTTNSQTMPFHFTDLTISAEKKCLNVKLCGW